jgi:pyridoxine 5-phosphate synthase
VKRHAESIRALASEFRNKGILVSLFIEPDKDAVTLAKEVCADYIEIHTGSYADAKNESARGKELKRILAAADLAVSLGLNVNAGHGLTCENMPPLLAMNGLREVNIGHSIISRAVFVGLKSAILEMKGILDRGGK